MAPEVISVSQFVALLNETLSFAYPEVTVEGEVSGFQTRQGKWIHFDIKDDECKVACFATVYQLKMPVEDGMKVIVQASPKLTKWGTFSLNVRSVTPAGEGELRRAFEILKQKLSSEGLFSTDRKRPLPKYPSRVGLITSADSAACADFLKVINSRWSGLTVYLADTTVQGPSAPDQIVSAINYFNQLPSLLDVLVITRGGGSLEDLAAFNTEPVVRSIASSRTPTIVGVGHEIDISLADLAADHRAVTPTDAGRLAVPDKLQIIERMGYLATQMEAGLSAHLRLHINTLRRLVQMMSNYVLAPKQALAKAEYAMVAWLRQTQSYLQHQRSVNVATQVMLVSRANTLITESKSKISSWERLLKGFDPRGVLARGYSIATVDGQILKSYKQTSPGDSLVLQLHEGKVESNVRRSQK